MKIFFLFLVISLFPLVVLAQKNGSVKGVVYDTASKQPVSSATVTVLQQKDSSLVAFVMTDGQGRFECSKLTNGVYRLLITHVNYHNSGKSFTISDSTKQKDFGNVIITDLSKMLEEVIVTAEAPPITLIGDTVQYNAGSFKVQPNANVEQLLKKLPGVKVEKDGSITAQGQTVKKVMVDGKEFFGNDPKIATRNLAADAIDKVQVYDRSSDQAQLTGFDDGSTEKTINLKLKKDKKKGMFGKITAGAGTNDRYEGRFNVNSFKGARQLSVIGMGNNTNAEGFSFMDMLNFNGGLNSMRGGGGGGGISINIADASGGGQGGANNSLRTIWGGGLNYNNIIGNNTDFTSNYFYNRYNPVTESNVQRQYFLPDSSWFYRQNSLSNNLNNSHKVNLSADIRLDSFHSIKISPSLGYQDTRNKNYKDYQTLSEEQRLGNEGYSNYTDNSSGYTFRNDILFRKKFRRKGRTFSVNLQTNLNAGDGDGQLESINKFYTPSGSIIRIDSINQVNTITNDQSSYTVRAVYTEPLFRRSLLEFSVGNSYSRSNSEKITYDHNKQTGKFDLINEKLTNDFENNYGYTNAGLRLRTKRKKYNYSVGATWQRSDLEGKITTGSKDSVMNKRFYNILPNAGFQYSFTQFRNLNLQYRTNTTQPSLSQLQPVPDISDPLNIKDGNPNLKQEFTHAVQLMFMSVNPYKAKNLFAFITLQQTQNKIVNSDTINELGIKRTMPVNVNGVYNMMGNINLGLPLNFWRGSFNAGVSVNYNKGKQFINRAANDIRTLTVGPDIRFTFNPSEKLDLTLNAGYNYNNTRYSIRRDMNTNYFNHQYGVDVNWELPKKFYFNTEFNYSINNQLADGFNARVPLWNASLSKQFLANNRGELKLTAFDLLNQNVGISRNTNQNYIEDTRTTTLQRFFLLSFTYSLQKNGGGGPVNNSIRIMQR